MIEERIIKIVEPRMWVHWTELELKTSYELYQSPAYLYTSGRSRGRPNVGKITDRINKIFHNGKNVRSPDAVCLEMGNYRRCLKSKEQDSSS